MEKQLIWLISSTTFFSNSGWNYTAIRNRDIQRTGTYKNISRLIFRFAEETYQVMQSFDDDPFNARFKHFWAALNGLIQRLLTYSFFCSSYLGVMVDASRKYLNDKTLPIQINRTFHDLLRLCISLYTIVMLKHFFRAPYPVESSIDLYRESSYHSNTFSMHQLWHRERGAWIRIQDVLTKTNKKKYVVG